MKTTPANNRKRDVDSTPLTRGEKVVLSRLRKKLLAKEKPTASK